MASRNAIEPRRRTTVPGAHDSTLTTALPNDVVQDQCSRVAILYAVGAAIWAIGFVMYRWVLPNPDTSVHGVVIVGAAFASCLLSLAVSRLSTVSHRLKVDVGMTFMVPNAVAIALLNNWTPQAVDMRSLSWITILILIHAMIAPAAPRMMLGAGLVAARSE